MAGEAPRCAAEKSMLLAAPAHQRCCKSEYRITRKRSEIQYLRAGFAKSLSPEQATVSAQPRFSRGLASSVVDSDEGDTPSPLQQGLYIRDLTRMELRHPGGNRDIGSEITREPDNT